MWSLIALYLIAAIAANLLVWHLGAWASPFIAFVMIGLDLTLRDLLHERLGRWQMVALIAGAGALTWIMNPAAGQIAIASSVAFTAAAAADAIAYSSLRARAWLVRANGSNLVGAAVDSVIFPTIAFGAFLPAIVALQFAAKVGGGALWSFVLARARPSAGAGSLRPQPLRPAPPRR